MVSFATAAAAGGADWIFAVTISGVGTSVGIDKFVSRLPGYTTDASYKTYLMPWPSLSGSSVDPLGGVATFDSISCSLVDYDNYLASVFREGIPLETELSADVLAGATSFSVESASNISVDDIIWVNSEAMLVTSKTFDVLSVTRNRFDTEDIKHRAGDKVFLNNPYYRSRIVRLYILPEDAGSWSDKQQIGEDYYLDSLDLSDGLRVYNISARSQLKYLERLCPPRAPRYRVTDITDAASDVATKFFYETDEKSYQEGGLDSGIDQMFQDGFYVVFDDDSLVELDAGYYTWVREADVRENGVNQTPVAEISPGSEFKIALYANQNVSNSSFRWNPGTNYGGSISTSRLSGTWEATSNWVDILLCILTSSAHPDDGLELNNYNSEHGNWSMLPVGMGIGVPHTQIDWDSFMRARELTSNYTIDGFWYGNESIPFSELITKYMLVPVGAMMVVSSGLLRLVVPRQSKIDETPTEIGDGDILVNSDGDAEFEISVNTDNHFSSIAFKTRIPGTDKLTTTTINDTEFGSTFGQRSFYGTDDGGLVMELPYIVHDNNTTESWLTNLAIARLNIFRNPIREYRMLLDHSHYAVTPGDFINITHSEMPDPVSGLVGQNPIRALVTSVRPVIEDGTVRVDVVALGYGPPLSVGKIAPALRVSSFLFQSPNWSVVGVANTFTQPDAQYLGDTDTEAFTAGDRVRLANTNGTIVSTTPSFQTVQSVSSSNVLLDGNFGGSLAAGLNLIYVASGTAVAQQTTNYVYWGEDPVWRYADL